ncbi:MAG TPA: hypothetical protein VFA35_05465 [Burkholderiaceae bacterium]|nr:hypothetical protein [Burkholderiaceae bacterium]
MSIKRLTKEDIRGESGILNPVGHVVLAFKDDAVAVQAVDALHQAGAANQDILSYTAAEATPRLQERVRTASAGAGFGYEITLMRRYLAFAEEGAGWLIVYAPDDAAVQRITEVAKRFDALCAVRYRRLANEDLI